MVALLSLSLEKLSPSLFLLSDLIGIYGGFNMTEEHHGDSDLAN
jgi:hypothetical protein